MRMGQIARQIGVSREAPLLRFVTLCRPDPSHILKAIEELVRGRREGEAVN